MDKIALKPAHKDLIVPNPDNKNKALSADGEAVTNSRYWKRRLKDGDVVTTKLTKKSASKSSEKAKKSS